MKPRHFVIAFTVFAVLVCLAAEKADKGLKISQYPNNGFISSNALFITEKGDGSTNQNISFGQLALRITNGMSSGMGSFATTNYVNTLSTLVSNGLVTFTTNTSNFLFGAGQAAGSNLVVVLSGTNTLVSKTSTNGTNFYVVNNTVPAGFAAFEVQTNTMRLGLVTNLNWTYGMTGSVSGATAILGVDDSANTIAVSNGLLTIINTLSNSIVSANVFRTNQWTTNLAGTPVNGAVRFQGFEGQVWATNGARSRTFEWEPTNQTVRVGSLSGGIFHHHYLASSNYWDAPNLAYLSHGFGSNILVNASYSTVAGGVNSGVYTQAHSSFIGGGTNNWIRTNAFNSVITGGDGNFINVNATRSFIGGGSDNELAGGSLNSVVVGGTDNKVATANSYTFIGGGRDNLITSSAGTDLSKNSGIVGGELNTIRGVHSFIGGGSNNNIRFTSGNVGSVICGGIANNVSDASGSIEMGFIGGGLGNSVNRHADNSSVVGGRVNTIDVNSTNCFIGGGGDNTINLNSKFSVIGGGERNAITGVYAVIPGGASNSVTADRAWAIGTTVTNSTAGSVTVGELISYNTPAVISGAGSGSTNYLLSVNSPKMLLGSSNVNIYGVSGTIAGKTHSWSVNITNLSADTWGISFASGTNRWKFQSWMYGTNAPVVLTNNTLLRLQGESQGTNTLVTYQYFSPAL